MTTTIYLDASALETRAGRSGGVPELKCPVCGHWREELLVLGDGRVLCWRCRKVRAEG
jgi:hypothetical protein